GVDVPARASRGLRVRVEHTHSWTAQLSPIPDLLGIAWPVTNHHQTVGQNAPMRSGVPIRFDFSGLDEDVHVTLMRQDRQVGVETRGDLAGLGAGSVVRLLELNLAAGPTFPGSGDLAGGG